MAAELTQEEFSRHLNTKFRINAETPQPVELELTGVLGYRPEPNEQQGMERFSAVFSGPPDVFLSQGVYALTHEQMGDIQLFLVPLGSEERGFNYEAVFNYFKEPEKDADSKQ
jgi:hypothetical protein